MTEFGFSLTLFVFKLIIYESGVIKNVCLRKTQNAARRMRNENRQTRTSLPNIKKAQAKKKRQNYYPAAFIQIKFMFLF